MPRFVFLTNQASYHQMHFARAMAAELGDENFRIVFQKPTSAQRAEMGWKDDYKEPYILRFWKETDEVKRWINDADVVIQGRFPIKYVRQRIRSGKLTFAAQERLWKKRPTLARKLSRLGHFWKNYISVNRDNYHFLAIGHYAAKDLNDLGFFKGRSWKWGYFIDCPVYSPRPEQGQLKLLWCARLIEVKQPLVALEILQQLKVNGIDTKLTMIGDGELRASLEAEIGQQRLQDSVKLLGWQTQEQVFEHMQQADLFLMTSTHGEGWGLVVNEAMSNGCAVLANEELGSAQSLIKSGINGVLYRHSNIDHKLAQLSHEQIKQMGVMAHRTMSANWSATEAARRTIKLSELLLLGEVANARTLFSEDIASYLS